ncbi:50S ribosomal protein L16 [Candidatus Pacearchaeota archaeon]|nr:50S ribosomal protein L16 [Candidatus Pacearchaeota archaeon]
MASLRKAGAYSKKLARPYTRVSKNRQKAYIKTSPQGKIVKFQTGNMKAVKNDKYKYVIRYIAGEKVQVRDNALEACRMLITKQLDLQLPGQYFFEVKVFPHHILRENKTAAGAGADRLSSGMKHSFGITIGRAAMVNAGKEIFVVRVGSERAAAIARAAVNKVKPKVPCKGRVVFEKA